LENQTLPTEINPRNWTFLYISIEKMSMRAHAIRVLIDNQPRIQLEVPLKFDSLKCPQFSTTRTSPILYLGSAIRFSDLSDSDNSVTFAAGPGSVAPSATCPEKLLVRPDTATLPLTIYAVPYRSFASFLSSEKNAGRLCQQLRETTDEEVFVAVFQTLCNMGRITCTFLWPQILRSLRQAQLSPKADVFEAGLWTVLSVPGVDAKSVFLSIINGGSLWNVVDRAVLMSALFACFPTIEWRLFGDADLFIALIAQRSASDRGLIMSILQAQRKVPRTVKLLMTMMKCGEVSDWPSSLNRADAVIQVTILDCLLSIMNPKSVDFVTKLISFEELRYVFLMAPPAAAVKVFKLMAAIGVAHPEFFRTDCALQIRISLLAREESVWTNVMLLVSGDAHCKSSALRRSDLIPVLLTLIWSLAVQICHDRSYGRHSDLAGVEGHLNAASDYLTRCLGTIVESTECLHTVLAFFPLILNYPLVFEKSFTFEQDHPFEAIPQLKASNMSDASDSLWASVTGRVHFPACEPPLHAKQFLFVLLSEILNCPNLDPDPDYDSVCEWIGESPLFGFICNLVLHHISAASSLVFLDPFLSTERCSRFVPKIIVRLLRNVVQVTPPNFSFYSLFAVVHRGLTSLRGDAVDIFHQLFRIADLLFGVGTPTILEKCADILGLVMVSLFAVTPAQDHPAIVGLFEKRSPMFPILVCSSQMFHVWHPVLAIAFKDEIPAELVDAFTPYLDPTEKELLLRRKETPEDQAKTYARLDELARKCPPLPRKNVAMTVFRESSFSMCRSRYIATCKHFMIAKYLEEALSFKHSKFPIGLIHQLVGKEKNP
jgi:hypothetical protein